MRLAARPAAECPIGRRRDPVEGQERIEVSDPKGFPADGCLERHVFDAAGGTPIDAGVGAPTGAAGRVGSESFLAQYAARCRAIRLCAGFVWLCVSIITTHLAAAVASARRDRPEVGVLQAHPVLAPLAAA